jgi:hypothetical protein
LQSLVDAKPKEEIKADLWTLASRCNDNLKKKILTFPDSVRAQPQPTTSREENKEVGTGAKAKEKAEEKRREAEQKPTPSRIS